MALFPPAKDFYPLGMRAVFSLVVVGIFFPPTWGLLNCFSKGETVLSALWLLSEDSSSEDLHEST